jgi:N utilization substance protein A
MGKIRLGPDDIQLINLLEKITGARARDVVMEGDKLCFLLGREEMGLAIGKGGCNIEKARVKFGKNILLIEYSEDYCQFVRNIFRPSEIDEVRISKSGRGKNIVIKAEKKYRRQIIGVGGERINLARRLLDRYLGMKDVVIETA